MDWRSEFLKHCGPGLLGGITLPDWLRLLREQGASIDFSRLPRVLAITFQSFKNTIMLSVERRRFHSALEKVVIQPPLFVLGHWRSGTTHLHQLIAQDARFAFPNSYQAAFPHTFLTTEAVDSRFVSFFLPRHRPMDRMEMRLESPQEDEFAICVSSLKSPCLSWVFPRRKAKFEKYLTLRAADSDEITQWKESFRYFLKKLQWCYSRPLVLKSPPHTARVRLLLEVFPQARFVHIHRNPYRVFQSSQQTFLAMFKWHGLQRPQLDDVDEWILRQYREMYEAFFDERRLIPAGRLHEMCFEKLERDPVGEMSKMYQALDLGNFEDVRPTLQGYVNSLARYQKNTFTELSPDLKAGISRAWKFCFDEWGYSMA